MAVQPKQNDDIALYEYQLPSVSAKEQQHIYDCYHDKPLQSQSINQATREKKLLVLLVILQILIFIFSDLCCAGFGCEIIFS